MSDGKSRISSMVNAFCMYSPHEQAMRDSIAADLDTLARVREIAAPMLESRESKGAEMWPNGLHAILRAIEGAGQ